MTKHLQSDLDNLKKQIVRMGVLVEEATGRAITALVDRRMELATQVQAGDDEIDATELAVEDACLKTLALHQPVASDLRFVITVLKVNNDLERVGDLAGSIAERAAYLASHEPIGVPLDFNRMAEEVRSMLRGCLDALVNLDTNRARDVLRMEDEVDTICRDMFVALQDLMRRSPPTIERAIHTLSACRHLERIADLATNIAEDVVFLVDGEVIRHRVRDYVRRGSARP
ncbi:MAG: phosphate signaling complex protein PhoU [Planctomycetes bacterium]|nr:phosphate signaling complex protein PhoU [Planctomycetota bacterium]